MTPPRSRPLVSGLAALALTGGLLAGAAPALAANAPHAVTAAVAAAEGSVLISGQQLGRGQSIVSANGTVRFVLQDDGNAVVYTPYGVVWQSATQGRGDRLIVQTDGNVVIYDAAGRPVWFTGTDGEPGATLTIQDDGNLVVYRATGTPAWASSVNGRIPAPDTTTLASGQSLLPGQQLTGRGSIAVMQRDGNLVTYTDGRATWSTGTTGAGNRLVMQTDGNAVVYGTDGSVKWASGTAGNPGARMELAANGELFVAGAASGKVWSSTGQLQRDTLDDQSGLADGDKLTSQSGAWRAVMQKDGNFVVYGARGADWSTGTSIPDSTLVIDPFGYIVIFAPGAGEGQGHWENTPKTTFPSGPQGIVAPFRLVMQDDGNLVEYDGLGRAVWASRGA